MGAINLSGIFHTGDADIKFRHGEADGIVEGLEIGLTGITAPGGGRVAMSPYFAINQCLNKPFGFDLFAYAAAMGLAQYGKARHRDIANIGIDIGL